MPQVIRTYHFIADFYADEDLTVLAYQLSSEDFWPFFKVDGSSISSTGVEIADFSCLNLELTLPPDSPSFLFNRVWWIKVTPFVASSSFGAVAADVVFVVDESGSMINEHEWLDDMIGFLDSALSAVNIGPNRYAIVGYGRASPEAHIVTNFTTAANAKAAVANLVLTGGTEDGYQAIDFALNNLSFRDYAVPSVILITDEDRDIIDPSITQSLLKVSLSGECAGEGILTSVVNANFIGGSGSSALGVSSSGHAFIQNGVGYTNETGGAIVTSFETTKEDYVDLTWDLGGTAWDLNVLREGGSAARAFTSAFVDSKVSEIIKAFVIFTPDTSKFFCPKDLGDDGIIDIPFSPFYLGGAVSDTDCYQFRISFYADADRSVLIHSGFSLLDTRRWFVIKLDGTTVSMNSKGVVLDPDEVLAVRYKPTILPQQLLPEQDSYGDIKSSNERPLLCGVTYYVTVDAYQGSTFTSFDNFEYRIPCKSVDDRFWRGDKDALKWLSSGNGRSDIRVSHTQNQALKPALDSNKNGLFLIAWQDFRATVRSTNKQTHYPQIYYSFYDSDTDRFWSSGQGYIDHLAIATGYTPLVYSLLDNNFHITSYTRDEVYVFKCDMIARTTSTSSSDEPCLLTGNKSVSLNSSIYSPDHFLKAKVYDADTRGSYVVASGNVVSIVDSCVARLEVSGAPGAYAIRARNDSDSGWSSWIMIDTLADDSNDTAVSSTFRSYSIDNERFILPWQLSPGNGLKRVCLQVLTLYGVSKIFCVDILTQVEELIYDVELSYSSSFDTELPAHEGYPVLAPLNSEGTSQTVYVRVTFKDAEAHDKVPAHVTSLGNTFTPTFSVVQQGLDDQYNISLTKQSGTSDGVIYTGSFTIGASDDVFIKEGVGAIVVNIPDPCLVYEPVSGCELPDNDDFYNSKLGINATNNFVTPADVLSERRKSSTGLISNIVEMKQYYSMDDPRFNFGKPEFFKDSNQ